jgi:pimeloyl-ACP methyl ester carboxylesterase
VLWGNQDTITPIDQAADLLTLLPQASLTVLPGLGHIPQIEDPALFNDALLKSLGKL